MYLSWQYRGWVGGCGVVTDLEFLVFYCKCFSCKPLNVFMSFACFLCYIYVYGLVTHFRQSYVTVVSLVSHLFHTCVALVSDLRYTCVTHLQENLYLLTLPISRKLHLTSPSKKYHLLANATIY